MKKNLIFLFVLLTINFSLFADDFVVTNTDDTGAGSLREAITNANNNIGADNITFNISGTGPHYIFINSALPALTDAETYIDGTTQTGYVAGNPNVYVWGTSNAYNGITINAANCTIDGLVISGFNNGIVVGQNGDNFIIGKENNGNIINGNNNCGIYIYYTNYVDYGTINSNKIGTNNEGNAINGNASHGIYLKYATNITITNNLISANGGNGIFSGGWNLDLLITNNKIGTDITGTINFGNSGDGISIYSYHTYDDNMTIGGAGENEGNLISANLGAGIKVVDYNYNSGENLQILGNKIGTDITGTIALGNGATGIWIEDFINYPKIGGFQTGEGNLISGNYNQGIYLNDSYNVTIQGNKIGVDINGEPLGNEYNGILLSAGSQNNIIGGTLPNSGNTIAYNLEYGINDTECQNSIMRNSIYCNELGGVSSSCYTAPVITEITANSVTGTATAGAEIDLYYIDETCPNTPCDQGQTYISTVNTTGAGIWTYNGTLASENVTAIARNIATGSTSAFSFCGVLSSENDIVEFYFPQQASSAVIDPATHNVNIELQEGVDLTNLIATFVLSEYAEAYVSSTFQENGVTANDFTSPVIYTIISQDGTEQDWTVTATISGERTAYCYAHGYGLASFSLNDPENLTYIADITSVNSISAASWADDVWYAAEYYDGVNGGNLYSINPETGVMTEIGFCGGINGMAYDPENEIMYAISNIDLFTINLQTGATTLVGSTGVSGVFINLACDFNGNLYSIEINNDYFYSINAQTGNASYIASLGENFSYMQDMEFDRNSGLLYLAAFIDAKSYGELRIINTQTGEMNLIGDFPSSYDEISGLCIPYENLTGTQVNTFSFPEQVGNTVINNENHTVSVIVSWETDVSDLTATFDLSDGAIAYVDDVIQVSGITSNDFTSPVTYQIISQNEKVQQDWVVTVSISTIVNNFNNTKFLIYPNPATTQITISGAENSQFEIYNSMGQLLLWKNIYSENQIIDLSKFQKGVYVIRITKKGYSITEKLIIN